MLLYPFDILQDLIVPEPQHPVTLSFEMAAAALVVANAVCVLASINFNGQPFLHAHEIDYERPYGMLSAESEFAHLTHSHMTPQKFFRVGGIASKLA